MDDNIQQPNITIQSLDSFAAPQIGTAAVTVEAALPPAPVLQYICLPAPTSPEPEKFPTLHAQIQEIEVAKISPNPFQPRKVFETGG